MAMHWNMLTYMYHINKYFSLPILLDREANQM